MTRTIGFWGCLLWGVLSSAPALAAKKKAPLAEGPSAAVLKFQGPGAPAIRAAVAYGLLQRKVRVRAGPKADATVPRAKSSSDFVDAATNLGVSCVVTGTVKPGKARPIVLRVYNGEDGRLLKQVVTKAPGAAGLAALKKTVYARLKSALLRCGPGATPEADAVAEAETETETEAEAPPSGVAEVPPPATTAPPLAPSPVEETPAVADTTDPDAEAEALGGRAKTIKRRKEEKKKEKEKREEVASGGGTPDHPALDASIGVRGFSRRLRYSDDIFGVLSKYTLPFWPAGVLAVDWYPASHFTTGWLTYLGLTAQLELSAGIKSSTATGDTFKTTYTSFLIGPKFRYPIGRAEVVGSIAYGGQSFGFTPTTDSGAAPLLPDVSYKFLRFGASGRVPVSERFAVGAGLGYLAVTGTGELGSAAFFPRISGGGFDLGLFGSYAMTNRLDLRLGFDFRRYFFSMNPEVGDPLIAGGATDQYVSVTLGLGLRL